MGIHFYLTVNPRPVFENCNIAVITDSEWSVSLAHVTVACATKWHIRVRKSMEAGKYRGQCAQCPVPLPVLVKYVTLLWDGNTCSE